MKNTRKSNRNNAITKLFSILIILSIYTYGISILVQGVPSGASVVNTSVTTGPTVTAGNRSYDGGTITTLNLTSTQQNFGWKAYVGNVTGSLTLDDANSNTIYDWSLSSITGEVYASRDSNVNWGGGSIACATQPNIITEQTFIGGSPSDSDSINNTYNYTQHPTMQVGVTAITNSSCRATYTFLNDTRQVNSESGNFSSILLQDGSNDIVYATFIESNDRGYNDALYDFQLLLPDQDNASQVTYYFYLEIGS